MLIFVLKSHLQKNSKASKAYLGMIFLSDLETNKQELGSRFIEPFLYLIRLMSMLFSLILLSSFFWPTQSPKGTLVINQGPIEIQEDWPRPVHVVSAQAPHHILSTDFQKNDQIDKVDTARLLGPPKFLDALSSALEDKNPQAYYYQNSETVKITGTAEWKSKISLRNIDHTDGSNLDSSHLEINAYLSKLDQDFSLPKRLDLEVLTRLDSGAKVDIQASSKPRFLWQKFGELKQEKNIGVYRWTSDQNQQVSKDKEATNLDLTRSSFHLSEFQLAGKAIRLRSKPNARIQIAYPLCVPLASKNFEINMDLGFQESKIAKLFNAIGFQSMNFPSTQKNPEVLRKWQIRRDDQLKQKNNTTKGHLHTKLWQIHGDQYSEFNSHISNRASSFLEQKRSKLLGIKKVWTPLASDSVVELYSQPVSVPNGVLALSIPQVPVLPSIFTSYRPIDRGNALLWLTQQVSESLSSDQAQDRSSTSSDHTQIWRSTHAVVSHELNEEGERRYHFGVNIHRLVEQSPLWLASVFKALVHEEAQASSSCYEWKEGDVLWAHLPTQVPNNIQASHLNSDGLLHPISLGFSDQNRIRFPAHQEGIYHVRFLSNALDRKYSDQDFFIARQKKVFNRNLNNRQEQQTQIIPSQSQRSKQAQSLAIEDLHLPWSKRLKRHWKGLSKLQYYLIYSCLAMLSLCSLFYFYWRGLILFKLLISLIACLGCISCLIWLHPLNNWSLIQGGENFNLITLTQMFPHRTHSDSSSNLAKGGYKVPLKSELRFQFEGPINQSALSFKQDWEQFNERLDSLLKSDSQKEAKSSQSILFTSIPTIYQSQGHQERFKRFKGQKWLKPSFKEPIDSRHFLLTLSHYSVQRDESRKEILLEVLLKSSASLKDKIGELYVQDAKAKFRLSPQGNLLSFRIKDLDQRALKLKLAYHDVSAPEPASNTINEQEIIVPLPRVKRRTFWMWGTHLYKQLLGLGLVLAEAVNTQQLDAFPRDLFGIALHKVDPKYLSMESIEQLYEWVSQGGLLIWSGSLSEVQKKRYRSLEKNKLFRALTPLSAKSEIPRDREAQLVFIVDRSGSTDRDAGGPGLDQITAKLSSLVAQLAPKDEVTLISFGGSSELTLAPISRSDLSHLPVPSSSRGGTVLHPALELALSYRRPSLEAHWVIVSDGEWGDEPDRLLGDLVQRLKASDIHLSIAHFERSGRSLCQGLCERFAQAVRAQTLDWQDLNTEQLREPLRLEFKPKKLKLKSSPLWDRKVGGRLASVSGFTPMSLRKSSDALAFTQGFPIFAEKKLGLGRVIQFMSDDLLLSQSQWQNLLNLNRAYQKLWSIELVTRPHHQQGQISEVIAYSDQNPPDGPVILNSSKEQKKGIWLSTGANTSVMANCEMSSESKGQKQCKTIALPATDPELYTIQYTADSQVNTVDLVTPSLGNIPSSRSKDLAENDLAMYWSQKFEQEDYQKFKQVNSRSLRKREEVNHQSRNQVLSLVSSHKLLPSLNDLRLELENKKAGLSKVHFSLYIGLISIIFILATLIDTFLWRRETMP